MLAQHKHIMLLQNMQTQVRHVMEMKHDDLSAFRSTFFLNPFEQIVVLSKLTASCLTGIYE